MSGNFNRNGVSNKKEKDKRLANYIAKNKKGLNRMSTLVIVIYAILFIILSLCKLSEEHNTRLSYILAYFSFWMTICFELNEWAPKFKIKNSIIQDLVDYIKDISTYPAIIGIIILAIQLTFLNITNLTNYNNTNFICSLTIFIYILSIYLRSKKTAIN